MNIIELSDIKIKPDVFYEYNASIKDEEIPLVIDNGSYKCRVGWSTCDKPLLEFRNLIAKPRKDRKKDLTELPAGPEFQIGNDITNIEAVRMQLKTQFDRNVVTHFHNQQQLFDYTFEHLNIEQDGCVPHPIVLTEAIGNPNHSRKLMSELLFECYNVPAVSYGIDSLFSLHHNSLHEDALILSFGYFTTHVIPVLNGKLQAAKARRLNIGGYHIITYLYRLMQMKYPVHLNAITISRMETLIHKHSSIAVDYQDDLRQWSQADFYTANVKKIQLPYTVAQPATTLTVEQKNEKRRELGKRLIELNARRNREKLVEDEEQFMIMSDIRALHETGEKDKFQAALKDNELANLQELDKLMTTVSARIERTKQRLATPTDNTTQVTKEKTVNIAKPPPEIPLDEWLTDLKAQREELLKRKHGRKMRRQDLAKRHTLAAQERMRIISQLARNEKGADEFGMDDKDWDVYKVISRNDDDSDSEVENEKLNEFENILRHYDTNFDDSTSGTNVEITAENYQLHVGVESLRAPELLFQPSMIGSSEAGIAELIDYVLKLFTPAEQLRLANNVFMTGGCAQFPGLKQRLSKELLEMRPFQTTHNIIEAQIPDLDAWLGARDFARSENFKNTITTRSDYEENGSEYFRIHNNSNLFFSTPQQIIQ
ncbi:actin-related protein 5 [Teleopsis dalmanni]|uniref:actin-related protein 5 n=1 Tax=Teleopsis dalmanni TaxID=139649 RepID=UPI0018CCF3E5|nr:actin-related protein 5 [Teleopsis dalmanni]